MHFFIALNTKSYKHKKGTTPIDLTWENSTIMDWCNMVSFSSKDVVTGHSIGASVALMIAARTPPKELHLYSPSPIFKETLGLLGKKDLGYLGRSRVKEVRPIPIISCPLFIYIGSLEHKVIKENARIIKSKIPGAKLVVIEGKDHENII